MLYNNTCITAYAELLTFSLSNEYCNALGKQLVQIESYDKLQVIKSGLQAYGPSELWIGLHSLSSNFTNASDFSWLSASSGSSNFTNWEQISTNEKIGPQYGRCATINRKSLLWNNRRCTSFHPFICEQGNTCSINGSLYCYF